MSLANKITTLRIFLIPFFLFFLYSDMEYGFLIAAIIFLICAITDFIDGYVARKQNTVSVFGKVFDPIADKILVVSALIPLTAMNLLPAWVSIVLISREFIISGFRIVHSQYGKSVIAASWLGKVKTVMQDTFIIMIMVSKYWAALNDFYITWAFIILGVVFALWSLIDYLSKNIKTIDVNGDNNEG